MLPCIVRDERRRLFMTTCITERKSLFSPENREAEWNLHLAGEASEAEIQPISIASFTNLIKLLKL